MTDVYEQYKHLDHLLSSQDFLGKALRDRILYDLWQAVKDATTTTITEVERLSATLDADGFTAKAVIHRLETELAALQELYADRDRDLAFEYARANTAEAALDALREETANLRRPCLCCRVDDDCVAGCRCHPQHGAPLSTTMWQPITTAPRDGSLIDVWCIPGEDADEEFAPEHGGVRLTNVFWHDADEIVSRTGWMRCLDNGDWDAVEDVAESELGLPPWHPVQWMPVPKPPLIDSRPQNFGAPLVVDAADLPY